MKNTLYSLILGCALILIAPHAHAQQAFFSSIKDVPIKPGLVELPDQTLSFDKPQGRIIESIAEIKNGSRADTTAFYQQSLPQLGWKERTDGTFTRENERLIINFERYESKQFMRLMLEPK